jgi:flagellar hook-associated protein 1 FlgK
MSISSSLSAALSGLTVTARAAELVASNVANAMTDGYVRRELELAPRTLGGQGQGVRVSAVSRDVDRALLSDRRIAQASAGDRDARAAFHAMLETELGDPEAEGSLGARINAIDSALIAAASRPESEARLSAVLQGARQLAAQFGAVSDAIQSARAAADDQIASQVDQLNQALHRVQELNVGIRANTSGGRDASTLMDLRQQEIDRIAAMIPIREVDRDHGVVALYATGGAVLLDGKAATLGFTPVGVVTPDMTLASGVLSGLTLNGRPMETASGGLLSGGTLGAAFAVRDDLAPAAQGRLDAMARNLVERFQDPAVDPTLVPGEAGLFTDQGAAFDPAGEIGLSQRLQIHAAVDPQQGGVVWRLRDGLGATTPGVAGESALLKALQGALSARFVPASGGFAAGAQDFAALGAELVSSVSAARLAAEAEASFASARAGALQQEELVNGVDTDQEMQKLLLIEQAYAANAKVVQTVDELIQTLLSL